MLSVQIAIVRAMTASTYSPMWQRWIPADWGWGDRIGMIRDLVLLMIGLWDYESTDDGKSTNGAVGYLQDVLGLSRGTASRLLLHLRGDGADRYESAKESQPEPQDGPKFTSFADIQSRYAEDMGLITIDGDADEGELLTVAGDLDTLCGPMSDASRAEVIARVVLYCDRRPGGPADRLCRMALPHYADLQDLQDLLLTQVKPIGEVRARKSNARRYPSWYVFATDRVSAYRRAREDNDSYWRLGMSSRDDSALANDPAAWLESHAA